MIGMEGFIVSELWFVGCDVLGCKESYVGWCDVWCFGEECFWCFWY